MALLPKKTYSKRDNELNSTYEKEKENVDPFDELLSSPLKQEVQFQPLSFWGNKVKHLKSKKKAEKRKYGLYELSDSDESVSPCQRKKKAKSRNSVSKARTLQCKSTNCKLTVRRNKCYSTAYIKRIKSNNPILLNSNKILMSSEVLGKNKEWSSNNTFYFNENMEESKLSSNCCNNLKFFSEKNKQDHNHSKTDFSNNLNRSFSNNFHLLKSKKKNSNDSSKLYENVNSDYSNYKINKNNDTTTEQVGSSNDCADVVYEEDPINGTLNFPENPEEISSPFYKHCDNLKFISVKRHFNYPNFFNGFYENFKSVSKSNTPKKIERSPNQSWNNLEDSVSPSYLKVKPFENVGTQIESLRNLSNKTYNREDLIDNSLDFNDNMDKTLDVVDTTSSKSEILESTPLLDYSDENTFLGSIDFTCLNNTEVDDLIQELLKQKNGCIIADGAAEDSSSTSDDISSELQTLGHCLGSNVKKKVTHSKSPSKGISLLTTGISDLSISNTTGDELPESEKLSISLRYKNSKDPQKDSFLMDLKNVTTKRRGHLSNTYEKNAYCGNGGQSSTNEARKNNLSLVAEQKFEQSVELSLITNRMSVDCDKSVFLANPLFESTRVTDLGLTDGKVSQKQTNSFESIMGDSGFDHKFALKPGKKWLRSISVLRQLQNKSLIEERLESTKITGRKFESFVQDLMKLQNDQSGFFTLCNIKVTNKTFSDSNVKNSFFGDLSSCKTILECKNAQENERINGYLTVNDSVFSKSISNSVLEKSLLNRVVKVTEPKEGSSYFRSALGLEIDRSLILEDSIQSGSSAISARDFILMQCGQEDILSFEEHFNERTLKHCKKIGEGVYGEVFMSCDSVIKVIPIEGSEKVNGEPQKTFEEIISEVVIASKLSNLREGKRFRTDGFSEMKRCWCVKGKYPKYLIELWNQYDQQGNGSENESPVMFNDNQLYIILELANGGKNLESFVFSSSAQSLSIFIQASFSLAAAEKFYEFEHRDLHWGNVLISETQNKFMTVILDGIEYKIPTKGVKVCIIDFTLSRINHENCCIFNDLSIDPGLFASEGDYQFEIYRMMMREVKNDWSLFRPKTNLFWLHYTLDKMIKMVRYKYKKTKVHLKHLKDLKTLESVVLQFNDSVNLVLSQSLGDALNKLI